MLNLSFVSNYRFNNELKCQIILKRGFEMKENFLVDSSKQFTVDIVNLCIDVKENLKQ